MLANTITQAQACKRFSHIPNPLLSAIIRKAVAKKRMETASLEQTDAEQEVAQQQTEVRASDAEVNRYSVEVDLYLDGLNQGRESMLSMLSVSSNSSLGSASTLSHARSSLASNLTDYSDIISARQSLARQSQYDEKPLPPDPPTTNTTPGTNVTPNPDTVPIANMAPAADTTELLTLLYTCTCGTACSRPTDLKKHVLNKHMRFYVYRCKSCAYEGHNTKEMDFHCQRAHGSSTVPDPPYVESFKLTDGFSLTCPRHNERFSSLKDFIHHQSTDAEITMFQTFLMQPGIKYALERAFESKFKTSPTEYDIQRLTWTPAEARKILSKHQVKHQVKGTKGCLVNLYPALDRIVSTAIMTEPGFSPALINVSQHVRSYSVADSATPKGLTQSTLDESGIIPPMLPHEGGQRYHGPKRQPSTDASRHPNAPPYCHPRLESESGGASLQFPGRGHSVTPNAYIVAPAHHEEPLWHDVFIPMTDAGMHGLEHTANYSSPSFYEQTGPEVVLPIHGTCNYTSDGNPDVNPGLIFDNESRLNLDQTYPEPLHADDTNVGWDGETQWNGYGGMLDMYDD